MPHLPQHITWPTDYPTRDILNLGLQAGQPSAAALLGNRTAQDIGQNVPNTQNASQAQLFGLALMNLLRESQKLGTRPFAEQEFVAREAQQQRILQQTPQELIGASPGIQSQVRAASVEALQPTIQAAEQSQQTFGEQLRNFGSSLQQARALIKDFEDTEAKKRDDARLSINNALTLVGGGAFEGLDPQEVSSLEKIAGYPKGYLAGISKTLKERDLELKRQHQLEQLTQEQKAVQNLAQEYPDAGIVLIDTLTQAQAKLPQSRIYQQRTRLGRSKDVSGRSGGIQARFSAPLIPALSYEDYVFQRIGNPTLARNAISKGLFKDDYNREVLKQKLPESIQAPKVKETPEVRKAKDYKRARQFLADNPDADENDLRQALLENTRLSITEINVLLKSLK